MADEIEVQPVEMEKSGEGSDQAETQKLDNATFEPQAFVEQTGDYKQAEAIQENFVAVTDNMAAAADSSDQAPKGEATRQGEAAPSGDTASQAAASSDQAPKGEAVREGSEAASDNTASRSDDSSDQAPKGEVQPPMATAGRDNTISGLEPKLVNGRLEKADDGKDVQSAPVPQPVPNAGLSASLQRAGEEPAVKFVDGAQPAALRQAADKFGIGTQELNRTGFAAVKAYLTGFHESGAGSGTSGYTDSPAGSGIGGGQNNMESGQGSKLIGQSIDHGSPQQTPTEVWDAFTEYCHDAYQSGDHPADGDVEGWIADKAKEFFKNVPGTKDLLDLWNKLAKENRTEAGKTTVVREGQDGDEPGTSGGGNSDEPGTSGKSKGGSSENNNDDEEDDDEEDDDDDGGDNGGDSNPEPGEEDPGGGDEPGTADGEDDSGHGHGIILKDGGSSGGGDEQDDTGHRTGVEGPGGGSGGSSGGGDDSGDDTGRKGGIFGGGTGINLSDNQGGWVDPIGPAGNQFNTGENPNAQKLNKQTGHN